MKIWFISLMLIVLCFCSQPKTKVRLNEIKVIGSHNSYKIRFEEPLFKLLSQVDSSRIAKLHYDHIPIIDQLRLGLRNLEIDVFHDPQGGHFSNPKALEWLRSMGIEPEPFDNEGKLEKPGLKVFHIQDFDFRSHELLFSDLLESIKVWSDETPEHVPVFITLEAKDKVIDSLTAPLPFTKKALDGIDAEILKYLGEEKLITPDWVRGGKTSLNEKITTDGWPILDDCLGKFIFVLDNHKGKRTRYVEDHPGLKGRIMFVDAAPGSPEAAFLIRNDPKKQGKEIEKLISQGYIIRTRADASTREARSDDYSKFEAAKACGAQVITTDYYLPTELFPSKYKVVFENDTYEIVSE